MKHPLSSNRFPKKLAASWGNEAASVGEILRGGGVQQPNYIDGGAEG